MTARPDPNHMAAEYDDWLELMAAYADGKMAAPAGASSELTNFIEEARHRKDFEMMNFRVSEQVSTRRSA